MTTLKTLLRSFCASALSSIRRQRDLQRQRMRISKQLQAAMKEARAVKIIIGAGPTRYPGWIATDLPAFNALKRRDWARLFPPGSIDRMLAEHVFEHVTSAEFAAFLGIARDYLAPGGRIRIALPDGHHPDSGYIAQVRPGGSGLGAEDHKVLYTSDSMSELLRGQGFQFQLLEYFDAEGCFHRHAFSADDGFVVRSAGHDKRNQGDQLNYTSLIVDCWL